METPPPKNPSQKPNQNHSHNSNPNSNQTPGKNQQGAGGRGHSNRHGGDANNKNGNQQSYGRGQNRPPRGGPILRSTKGEPGRFHQYRGFFFLVFAALSIWLNLTFIVPVVMGAIFATVLHPLMGKMSRIKVSKTWKATIVTLGFVVGFLLPISMLVVAGAERGIEQVQHLQESNVLVLENLSPGKLLDALGLRPIVSRIADISPLSESQIRQYGARAILTAGAFIGRILQDFLSNLPGAMFAVIVILFTLFFLLIDGPRAVGFIRQNSIFGKKQTDKLIEVVHSLCYSVLVATVVSGAVQAGIIGAACLITGTPGVMLIVLVSFFASFFPLFGTAPVTIFLTAQAFLSGNPTAGFVFLASIPIVGVSDNIVRPYVLKGGAELHPLIGFVAAFGALDAIGFYGLFIGPVVTGFFFALLPMLTATYSRQPEAEITNTSAQTP